MTLPKLSVRPWRRNYWHICAAAALIAAPAAADLVSLPATAVKSVSGAVATYETTTDGIAIVRLAGDYDRGSPFNASPRQAVAQAFLEHHPDTHDFLVVLTTFDFDRGGADAFYVEIENSTLGLGRPLVDHGPSFGSGDAATPGRLQGYVDLGNLASWTLDLDDPDFERLLATLAHEIMHRWCCYVDVASPGQAAGALRGVGGDHWSDLFSSGASVMYGHDWVAQPDGSFHSAAIRKFFGPLDLYLAGMLRPEQVQPLTLIENAALDPAVFPEERDTVTGVARTVTVDQVIAATGPRIPAASDSQKRFRAAFVVLARDGDVVGPGVTWSLGRLREAFEARFAILTGGQGRLEIFAEASGGEVGEPVGGPTGGPLQGGPADLDAALTWLRGQQAADGSFADTVGTRVRETETAASVLTRLDPLFGGEALAAAWLAGVDTAGTDGLARSARGLRLLGAGAQDARGELVALQGADGGWGAGGGWSSDPLDTALALSALLESAVSASVYDRGVAYLLGRELSGGGWSSVAGGPARAAVTAEVLEVLSVLGHREHPSVGRGIAVLATRQNQDGGFGDSPSTPHDTARVLVALQLLGATSMIDGAAAQDYLGGLQSEEGSFGGSVYTTALAVAALRNAGSANLQITRFVATPLEPIDGQPVELELTVTNLGGTTSPATTVDVFAGDPDATEPFSGGLLVGPLAPGASRYLSLVWQSYDQPGVRRLVAVVDPLGGVTEAVESDNRASIDLLVRPAPAGAEVAVAALDALPGEPTSLPVEVALTATLSNIGQAAADVGLRVTRADGSELHTSTVHLAGRSSQPWSYVETLLAPGSHEFVVSLDPLAALAELDETDNERRVTVSTRPRLDLEVAADRLIVAGTPVVGAGLEIKVTVRNRGTVDLERNVGLRVETEDESGGILVLATRSLFLAAGEAVDLLFPWHPTSSGSVIVRAALDLSGAPVLVDADPTNDSAELLVEVNANAAANLYVAVGGLVASPNPGLEGSPLMVSVEVAGAAGDAGPFVVRLYDGAASAGVVLAEVGLPGLAAGTLQTVELLTGELIADRDRQLVLVVDAANSVAELDEGDNVALLELIVRSLPDAAISAAGLQLSPDVPRPGDPVSLAVTVANLGEQVLPPVTVTLLDAGGVPVTSAELNAVPGGASGAVELLFTASASAASWQVMVDPAGLVREATKTNNSATLTVDVQDSDAIVTPRFFSPNGDGVQDLTRFVAREGGPSPQRVEVSSSDGEVVRSFADLPAGSIQIEWDGRDQRGRLVADGGYRLRAVDANGLHHGEAMVVLDTDRSPLVESILAGLGIEMEFGCDPARALGEVVVSRDEQWMFFRVRAAGGYRAGLYRMTLDGSLVEAVMTLDQPLDELGDFIVSRDGSLVIYQAYTAGVGSRALLWRDSGERTVLPDLQWDYMQFDPGGETLVVLHNGELRRYQLESLGYEVVASGISGSGAEVVPSPDGRSWLVGSQVIDLATGEVSEAEGLGGAVSAYHDWHGEVWSWDGRYFLLPGLTECPTPSADNCVAVYRRDGRLHRLLPVPRDVMPEVLFLASGFQPSSGDPQVLAGASFRADGEVIALRVAAGEAVGGGEGGGWVTTRFLMADLTNGDVQHVAWARPRWQRGEGAPEPPSGGADADPSLVEPGPGLWIPHGSWLLQDDGWLVGVDGSKARVLEQLDPPRSLVELSTTSTGHFALARRVDPLDPSQPVEGCADGEPMLLIRHLANLTADLRLRRAADGRTILIEGSATDANFREYRLAYALEDSPGSWAPIAPPTSQPVIDQVLQPWVAPSAARYLVRLTVIDRAGNRRETIKRISTEAPEGVVDLELSERAISPNGDAQVDETELSYRTLGPYHVSVVVRDGLGTVIRSYARTHDQATAGAIRWDGRNQFGQQVADGTYTLEVDGIALTVLVDTTPPAVSIHLNPTYEAYPYPPAPAPTYLSGTPVTLLATLEATAEQEGSAPIEPWVEIGEGNIPSRWERAYPLRPLNLHPRSYELEVRDLELSDYVGTRYRVVAEDELGNRAVLTAPAATEKLMLMGLGEAGWSAGLETWQPASLKPLVLQQYDPTSPHLTPTVDGEQLVEATLWETIGAPLATVAVEVRPPGDDTWTAFAIELFVDEAGTTSATPWAERFSVVIPAAALEIAESQSELRFTAVDVDGVVHRSSRIRVGVVGSPASLLKLVGPLTSLDSLGSGAGSGGVLEARRQALAALLARHGLDPGAQRLLWGWEELVGEPAGMTLRIQSNQDPDFLVPQLVPPLAVGGGVAIYPEPRTCGYYKVDWSVWGAGQSPFGTSELEEWVEDFCSGPGAALEARPASSCGAAAPAVVDVQFTPHGNDLDVLRVTDRNGTVLFSQVRPVADEQYDWELDLTDHPVSGRVLEASLVDVHGNVRRQELLIAPDPTAPVVEIVSPVEGQRVCGGDPQVVYRAYDETALSRSMVAALDLDKPHVVKPRPPIVELGWADVELPDEWKELGGAKELVSLNGGPVYELEGSLGRAALPGVDRELTVRLIGTGLAGEIGCDDVTFVLDNVARVQPVVAPSSYAAFSPNGDGVSDTAELRLPAQPEPMVLDLVVLPGDCVEDCPVLATLVEQAPVQAASVWSWDGRASDGNVLPDGGYEVEARLEDGCANGDQTGFRVEIDTLPPVVTLLAPITGAELPLMTDIVVSVFDGTGPPAVSLFYGAGSDPTQWFELAGRRWNTWGMSPGTYTLRAVAADRLGNVAETRVVVVIPERPGLITYLEPSPELFSPNGDGRRDATVARFGLSAPASVIVTVTNAQGAPQRVLVAGESRAAGSHVVGWDGRSTAGSVVPDGVYRLLLEATATRDGQPVVETEVVALRVDTTPPASSPTRPVAGGYLRSVDQALATVVDASTTAWRLAVVASPSGAGPLEVATGLAPAVAVPLELAAGSHTLRLDAEDEAGNRSRLEWSFIVDPTPPVVAFTNPAPDALVGLIHSPLAITATAVDESLEVMTLSVGRGLVPSAWTDLIAGLPTNGVVVHAWPLGGVQDGPWTLRISARDKAGNVSVATRSIVVDATPPELELTQPVAGGFVVAPSDIVGSARDQHLAAYELWRIAGGQEQLVALGLETVDTEVLARLDPLPGDGTIRLRLHGIDRAGNESTIETSFVVDTTPPAAPITLRARRSGDDGLLDWTASTAADLAGYHLYRDGTRINQELLTALELVDPDLTEGTYRYWVTAVDLAGLESPPSPPATLVIDTTAPTVELYRPTANARVAGRVEVHGSAHSDDFREYRLTATALVGGATALLRRSPVPVTSGSVGTLDTGPFAEGSEVVLRLEGEDVNGNAAAIERTVVIDTQPPAAPLNLQAVLTGPDQATLTWTAVSDPALAGYLLLRDGEIANASGPVVGGIRPYLLTATTYVDNALVDGEHVYVVYAVDTAENQSLPSNEASVTVESGPPHAVWVTPVDGERFQQSIVLAASCADADVASVGLDWRLPGGVWQRLATPLSAPYAAQLDPVALGLVVGPIELQAVATDTGGRIDPAPPLLTVYFADVSPPARAELVRARADGGEVLVTWTPDSTEPDPSSIRYYVERLADGEWLRLPGGPTAAATWTETGVADGVHRYAVVAVDAAGNEASRSLPDSAHVATPALVQPFMPTRQLALSLEGEGYANANAELTVAGPGGTTTATSTSDVGGRFVVPVTLGVGLHELSVRLTDGAGNRSRQTAVEVVTGAAPVAPTGVIESGVGYALELAWAASPESDLAGYQVLRGAHRMPEVLRPGLLIETELPGEDGLPERVTLDGLSDGDPNTGASLSNGAVWVTLPAESLVHEVVVDWARLPWAPSTFELAVEARYRGVWIPLGVVAPGELEPGPSPMAKLALSDAYPTAELRLRPVSSEGGGSEYQLREVEVTVLDPLAPSTTTYSGTLPDGRHQFGVTALSVLGFESASSVLTPEREVGDVVPPDPVVLSGALVDATATLTWTDAAEAELYELSRDGVAIAVVAGLAYLDEDLTNGTYRYRVVAFDAVGNRSADSNEVALLVDVPPPDPPNLLALALQWSDLEITWTPAETGSPALEFGIWRGTTPGGPYEERGRVLATDFGPWNCCSGYDVIDDGATRYFYVVVAYGRGEARSLPSNELVLDLATALDRPILTYPTPSARRHVATGARTTVAGFVEAGGTAGEVAIERDGWIAGTALYEAAPVVEQQPLGCPSTPRSASPSSDGRYLWVDCAGGAELVDFANGQVKLLPGFANGLGRFEPYRHSVLWVGPSGTLFRYDLDDDLELSLLAGVNAVVPSLEVGVFYALAELEGGEGLWQVADHGAPILIRALPGELDDIDPLSLIVSPGGSHVAWLRGSRLELVALSSGVLVEVTAIADPFSSPPQFSWDGSSLVYAEAIGDGTGRVEVLRRFLADGTARPLVPSTIGTTGYSEGPLGRAGILLRAGNTSATFLRPDVLTEVGFYDALDGGQLRWWWAPSGHAFGLDGVALRVTPPGRFELADVELVDGVNMLTARQAVDPVTGQVPPPSLPIEVEPGELNPTAMPNLTVVLDLVPERPVAGASVWVVATIQNDDDGYAESSALALAARGPNGFVAAPQSVIPVPAIAPGAAVTRAWSLVTPDVGDYFFAARADVGNEVDERREDDNAGSTTARVVAGSGIPSLTVETDLPRYRMDTTVQLRAEVARNGGATWSGSLALELVDGAGVLVADLGDLAVAALAAADVRTLVIDWPTETTFAGVYQVIATLTENSGPVVSQAVTSFEIIPTVEADATLVTSATQVQRGAVVALEVGLTLRRSNVSLVGTDVSLRIRDIADQDVFGRNEEPGTWLPGQDGSYHYSWPTASLGLHDVLLEWRRGNELLAQASVDIQVNAAPPAITGVLTVAQLPIAIGTVPIAGWGVGQLLGEPIVSLPLRVSARDGQQTLVRVVDVVATLAGGSAAGSVELDTTGLEPGRILISLEARLGEMWLTLDQATLQLVDRAPPSVEILRPAPGALLGAGHRIELVASDVSSDLETVEVQFDGGTWQATLETGRGYYVRDLDELPEGPHVAIGRARDAAALAATSVDVPFVLDRTPPLIEITGVPLAPAAGPVTPVVTVTDLHPGETSVYLDDALYQAGTPVSVAGLHRLTVVAVDGAGNLATAAQSFELTSPDLTRTATLAANLSADLDGNGLAGPGDRLRYELVVVNMGSVAAESLEVEVSAPTGATLVAGSLTTSAGEVVGNEARSSALAAGASWTVAFEATLDADFPLDLLDVALRLTVSAATWGETETSAADGAADGMTRTAVYIPVVASATGVEVAESAGNATTAVELDRASNRAVTLTLSTVDVTASGGLDYVAPPSSVEIPAGALSAVSAVQIVDDSLFETAETFAVGVEVAPTLAAWVRPSPQSGQVTIQDDDPPPTWAAEPVAVDEGDEVGTVVVRLRLDVASGLDASVRVRSFDGTATGGEDFTPLDQVVSIAAGQVTGEVLVTVLGDHDVEADETFELELSEPNNATLPAGSTRFAVTLRNDDALAYDYGDAPEPPYATWLASGGARHVVAPSGNPTLGVLADTEADGQPTAASDGDDLTGSFDEDGVLFPSVLVPGTQGTVLVSAGAVGGVLAGWIDWDRDGLWAGAGEQVALDVTLAAGTTQVLVLDVPAGLEPGPVQTRFRLSSQSGLGPTGDAADGEVEDHRALVGLVGRAVTLTAALATDLDGSGFVSPGDTVRYSLSTTNMGTVPATALTVSILSPPHSALVPGSISAPGGTVDGDVARRDQLVVGDSWLVTFDAVVDPAFPTSAIELSGQLVLEAEPWGPTPSLDPKGSADGVTRTPVFIPVSISLADLDLAESGGTGDLVIALDRPTNRAASLTVSVSGGTASSTDYEPLLTAIGIAAGETVATLTVTPVNDGVFEGEEAVELTATGDVAWVGWSRSTAVVRLIDDEPAPTLSIEDTAQSESAVDVAVRVRSSGPAERTVRAAWSTFTGTASSADFEPSSGRLELLAGATETLLTIRLVGDSLDEPDEAFSVELSAPEIATLGDAQAQVVLIDDDAAPNVSAIDVQATETEAGGQAAVPIRLSAPSAFEVAVHVRTQDGTAVAGADYVATAGLLTIPAGAVEGTFVVALVADQLDEPNETFLVSLSVPQNATLTEPTAVVSIVDDDGTPVPLLGVAKQVVSLTELGDGARVRFGFVVSNFGNTELTSLQIEESFTAVFAVAGTVLVEDLESSSLFVNPSFDGYGDTLLLAPGNNLAIGESAELELIVWIPRTSFNETYLNQVEARAETAAGSTVSDLSDDGSVADGDGDGDPTNDSDPTELSIAGLQQIPTLGRWGLTLVVVALGWLGVWVLRRRRLTRQGSA